jgi:hypothetical protein
MSHSRNKSTDVAWYNEDVGNKLGPKAREILEEYSKIPADQVESHVSKIVGFSLFSHFLLYLRDIPDSLTTISVLDLTHPTLEPQKYS